MSDTQSRQRTDDDRQPSPPPFKANARFASETPLDPANHARELDEVVAREKALDTDQRDVGSGGDWHLGASDKAWIKSRTDYAIIAAALLLTITWLIPKAQHFIAAIILALLALVASGFQAVASLSKADSRRDV